MTDLGLSPAADFIVVRSADQGIPENQQKALEAHSLRPAILASDAADHHAIGKGGVIEVLTTDPRQVATKAQPHISVMLDESTGLCAHDVLARFPNGRTVGLRLWLPTVTIEPLAERGISIRVVPGTLSVKGKFAQATGELVRPRSATEEAQATVAAALSPEEIAEVTAQVRADETAKLREEIEAEVTARVRAEVAESISLALSAFLAGDSTDSEAPAPQDQQTPAEDDFGDFGDAPPATDEDDDDFGDFEGDDQ